MNNFCLSVFLICTATLLISSVHGQNSAVLDHYISEGLSNNQSLQQQGFDLQKSQENIRQAKALFYPTLQFEANYTRAVGGRNIDFPVGDLLNPVYTALNSPQRVENQTIQFLPDNFQETKLKFAYPLFNSDLRYNRQIQNQLYLSKAAQKTAYEHGLRYRITTAYLQYLQALEAEKIWQNAKTVLTELRRFNEALVKNNVATRDVVATTDYELSKADQEIFKLHSNQNTARAYFNVLLNRDLQSEVIADTVLLRATAATYQLADILPQALANRAEFAALRAGLAAAETDEKRYAANQVLPDFYLGGELGFQGFGYKFNGEQAYVLARAGFTYDLFDAGLRKSKTQQARLENERLQHQYSETEQQIALQVTQAWNDFDAAKHMLQTAQSGLTAAEATFRIVNNKYRASQALLIEYLEAQNRVTTARLQMVLTGVDVLLREAELKQAAGL